MTYTLISESDIIFRRILRDCGASCPESYIWCDGDPQYLGNPISGRAVEFEQKAIVKMHRWLDQIA